jgi:hypothetical protein
LKTETAVRAIELVRRNAKVHQYPVESSYAQVREVSGRFHEIGSNQMQAGTELCQMGQNLGNSVGILIPGHNISTGREQTAGMAASANSRIKKNLPRPRFQQRDSLC